MANRFLAVRCPGCSSAQVSVIGPDKFQCSHCSLVFVYDRRSPPPKIPEPRPAPPLPPSPYSPPPQARRSGSGAGIVVFLIILSVAISAAVPIVFVLADLDDATSGAPGARNPNASVRGPEDPAQMLPCQALAERYQGCLVENENHTQEEAEEAIQPLRAAAAAALASGEASDEAEACTEQFDATIERCEGGGGLLGRLSSRASADDEPTQDRPSLLGRLRGEPEEPAPPVDMSRFQPLSGCECRGTRKAPRVELAIGVRGNKTVMGDPDYEYVDYTMTDWALTVDDQPWQLPATMDTAPPEALPGWRSTMGMACTEDTIVMASIRRVSAWSLADRKLLWTTQLDQPFGDDFAQGRRNSYQLSCRDLKIRKDVVEVPLDRRRRVRLGLADGKPR